MVTSLLPFLIKMRPYFFPLPTLKPQTFLATKVGPFATIRLRH